MGACDQRAPPVHEVDIVGGADLRAAKDTRRYAGIVDVAFAGEQIAMPGIAFGRGEPALGVHRRHVEKLWRLDAFDQRAVVRQCSQRTIEGRRYGLVEVVERDRGRHRKPHPLDRAGSQGNTRLGRQDRIEHNAARSRVRQRPKTVERG